MCTTCFRVVEDAQEEASEEPQKLIAAIDADQSSEAVKQRRSRSALMLKKELEAQGKAGSRDFLLKVSSNPDSVQSWEFLFNVSSNPVRFSLGVPAQTKLQPRFSSVLRLPVQSKRQPSQIQFNLGSSYSK